MKEFKGRGKKCTGRKEGTAPEEIEEGRGRKEDRRKGRKTHVGLSKRGGKKRRDEV